MKMKQLKYLKLTLAAAALTLLAAGCATQGNNVADTEVERALLTSGFKMRPANSPAQREQLRNLPDNQFTTVKQDGKSFYLYADKRENRLYVGDHYAYRAFQGYMKNKHLREQGVFVWEVNPADRSNNRTIQVWHDWTPFQEWQ
ncbi:MAG: hypothetical protein QOG67_1090 [Verrucomicrobiota bacterium]